MTTEESIIQEIRERARRGLSKYGKSVDGNPLSEHQWLQHAIEEALDLAIYLRRLQTEVGAAMPHGDIPAGGNVQWICPHCKTAHVWCWPAYDVEDNRGPITMVCCQCGQETECVGSGHGQFWPRKKCPRCGQPGKVITTTSGPACSRCVEE